MNNPLGIDIQHPRLSWEIASVEKNKSQKAYQILVSSDVALLEKDKADVWDSKKTTGNRTNRIAYQGKMLQANTLYYWEVRVWDEKGEPCMHNLMHNDGTPYDPAEFELFKNISEQKKINK